MVVRFILCLTLICSSFQVAFSQKTDEEPSKFQKLFIPSDTLNKARLWALNGTAVAGYTGVVLALDQIWYAQYPRSGFHTFNDMGEWEDMDKMGHLYTSYMESRMTSQIYQWSGLSRKKAAFTGFALGTIFQTTLETLDAFSTEWGWSWGDVAFNTGGGLVYLGQELLWKEQRIQLKLSSWRSKLDEITIISEDGMHSISLRERRNSLYGTNIGQIIIKDYNALTIWASVNVSSFMKNKNTKFPKWLNIAVGYGAENVYGGFSNIWEDDETGALYSLDANDFPRYRQFFLSFDVDLTKIPVKNRFIKSILAGLNILKIPSPSLEVNTLGKVKFHPFYF